MGVEANDKATRGGVWDRRGGKGHFKIVRLKWQTQAGNEPQGAERGEETTLPWTPRGIMAQLTVCRTYRKTFMPVVTCVATTGI